MRVKACKMVFLSFVASRAAGEMWKPIYLSAGRYCVDSDESSLLQRILEKSVVKFDEKKKILLFRYDANNLEDTTVFFYLPSRLNGKNSSLAAGTRGREFADKFPSRCRYKCSARVRFYPYFTKKDFVWF